MAKINKTYKAGDNFTPDSVNEIIKAINENVDNIAKKANESDVSSTYATKDSVNTELAKKVNTSALGTQVIFSLSGTTLTITSK